MALSKKLFDIYKKKAEEKCKELAKQAKKELSQEYEKLTDKFYDEYQDGYPEVYVRHYDRGYPDTGMSRTYKPYYKNKSNQRFVGGIVISEDRMYDDYRTSRKYRPIVKSLVLYSFLNGYHGLPGNYPGSRLSDVHPIEDMNKVKAKLMKKYKKKMEMEIKL